MLDKTLQPKAGLISNEGRGFKILPQQAIFYKLLIYITKLKLVVVQN